MKIQTKPLSDATKVQFIDGSLTKWVDRVVAQELHIGTGRTPESNTAPLPQRKLILLFRKVAMTAKQYGLRSCSLSWRHVRSLAPDELSDEKLGELLATALMMANYEHTTYKTKPAEGFPSLATVVLTDAPKPALQGIQRGLLIGEEVNACRELSNTPGGDMTPKSLAKAAKQAVAGTKASCKVLGKRDMEKLGMGAVLGIGKGAEEEPQFIIMEYWGTSKKQKPLALVGKGVTFDTGGLNIKPGDHMYEMHMDMSGGAAVIHAVALAAKLQLKANVVGLIPAVENAAGASSVRPGDILRSLSGKFIEVLNTDAEGRVILADGITYAKRYEPSAVIDVATLTGAALVALGTHASAFMTNDESKIPHLMDLAEKSGDYLWPFPAWEEYEGMTKSAFADVPNLSTDGNSRYGGVIAGGMFLKEFAKDLGCLWVHIDMAPRMTAGTNEFLAKGAAGAPVRFLLSCIENTVQ